MPIRLAAAGLARLGGGAAAPDQGVKLRRLRPRTRGADHPSLLLGQDPPARSTLSIFNKVIVGDSLRVMRKIRNNTFDMIFADPPYNLQLRGGLRRPDNTTVNGVHDEWDRFDGFGHYDDFTRAWLREARRVLKRSGTIWVMGSYHNIFRVGSIMQDLGYWILNDVHWIKSNPMPNFRGARFTNATETLIWAVKDKSVKGYTFNYAELKRQNNGKQMRNDWHFGICSGRERLRYTDGTKVHPTQKRIALLDRIVRASTRRGDLVLDPFSGTGTSDVAALMNGRRFTMIERDAAYASFSLARLKDVERQLAEPTGATVMASKASSPESRRGTRTS